MTHSHAHGPLNVPAPESKRVRGVLSAIILPLVVATIVGIIVLWPGSSSLVGSMEFVSDGSSEETAVITSLQVDDCLEAIADIVDTSNSSLLSSAVCAQIESGDGAGLILPVHIPVESLSGAAVGDNLLVVYTPAAITSGTPYVFLDYQRQSPVLALLIVYLVLVVAVAGKKGAASVVGLLLATAVLVGFMIPALLNGATPLWVALVGCSAMIFLAVYIAHGISIRTTTALLGTIAGVALTVGLSLWGVQAAHLTGVTDEDALSLYTLVPGLDMRALLTCSMVVAGLGILNDVTITQASAVWELHAANPALGRMRLFRQGMRIGRDHIASTVYTLAFAYAGTAMPLVMSAALIDRPVGEIMLSGSIAEEVVRTLISSIGLVLAIPATTLIAAFLCHTSASKPSAERAVLSSTGQGNGALSSTNLPSRDQPPETSHSASSNSER